RAPRRRDGRRRTSCRAVLRRPDHAPVDRGHRLALLVDELGAVDDEDHRSRAPGLGVDVGHVAPPGQDVAGAHGPVDQHRLPAIEVVAHGGRSLRDYVTNRRASKRPLRKAATRSSAVLTGSAKSVPHRPIRLTMCESLPAMPRYPSRAASAAARSSSPGRLPPLYTSTSSTPAAVPLRAKC